MRFVTRSEAEPFFLRLGIDRSGLASGGRGASRLKTFDAYYQSPLPVARQISEALAVSQGDFATCLLWAHDLVWGDRSSEGDPPPNWAEYRRWRETLGERRSLYEAPGHLFETDEGGALAKVIEWAISMGWDALIAAKPAKEVIHLSHDDRIRIYARSQPSRLIESLAPLGLELIRQGV